jgi:hypothetical protein
MPAGRPKKVEQLDHCREEGACCHECVRGCAQSLAAVTANLNSSQIRQIFLSMYSEPCCQRMASTFVSYVQMEQNTPPRKPVSSEFLFAMAAASNVA